jgi:C4-dicarboxylate transporter DctQ subunit
MILMAALYAFNVAVRELAAAQAARFAWIEEACLFALAWVVFLGLGLALERARHIAMTSLLERLAPRLQRGVRLAIDLAGLLFSLYVAKLALDITLLVMRSGQSSPTLDVSMAWLYAAMPVGFALLALRYALRAAA